MVNLYRCINAKNCKHECELKTAGGRITVKELHPHENSWTGDIGFCSQIGKNVRCVQYNLLDDIEGLED